MNQNSFQYTVEKFADIKILRFKVDGFEHLTLRQKKLIWYLGQAALCGRDILWDQNNRYNLKIRKVLETIWETYSGNRSSEEFEAFEEYLKRVWFANGIHHHYSMDKFQPRFSMEYFQQLIQSSNWDNFPEGKEKSTEVIDEILPVIFDPEREAKRVSLDSTNDLLLNSANNYYSGICQKEVEHYYSALAKEYGEEAPSFGLNSRLVKKEGKVTELVWKSDGLYGEAIQKIVQWLEKAKAVAENNDQQLIIQRLIDYYRSGNLHIFDEYSILWVKEQAGVVDFVNGFIEVYGDALGIKGSWESIVNFRNEEANLRTKIISENAQWFEDHSPVDTRFKKEVVKGVSAKVITVAMLGGDCYPTTPIGINLPNAEWIREKHGSKSVTIENISQAYYEAAKGDGFLEEFAWDENEIIRYRQFGYLGNNLHTDLHECLGHGSGKLLPGVSSEALKNYHSTLEETRADLFALYYIIDPRMTELGLTPSDEVAKAEYDSYIRNGMMTQLVRIELGKDIEESHMRNRQIVARWVYEQGLEKNVIEKKLRDGKTFFVINDYKELRNIFGQLLREVQRIKSEGDYETGKTLVENYGVKVDQPLHHEVLERYKKLDIPPYSGFLNPTYIPETKNGEITDIRIEYTDDFATQQLNYSKEYGFLPLIN